MNKQEIFDKVALHLLTQGRQATDGTFCQYLTSDGLKCAIGCLIPDGHPAQQCGAGARDLVARFPDLGILPTDLGTLNGELFLQNLQRIHDVGYPQDWPRSLTAFAHYWGLSPDVVTNFQWSLASNVVTNFQGVTE